jgi:hypothetical protein
MRSPDLPPAARALAEAVAASVSAARAGEAQAFAGATARLTALDTERVRAVLSGLLRPLLEDLHPDGLTGDDLRDAVDGCVRDSGWQQVDPGVLVVVLAGALGVHPGDEERPEAPPAAVTRHACLLVAQLLTGAPRNLTSYLAESFAEIARAETVEQP